MRISDWSSDVCSSDLLDKPLQIILREHLLWAESLGIKGRRADFSRIDMSGVKLQQIDLSAALFVQATLVEADFAGAVMSMTDFSDAMLLRSEEHTSELQSLMRISYAVFCLKKKKTK